MQDSGDKLKQQPLTSQPLTPDLTAPPDLPEGRGLNYFECQALPISPIDLINTNLIMNYKLKYTLLIISPFIIYALTLLMPTFDDWGYFTTPDYDFGDSITDYLIPRYTYWRPWDCIIGYILSLKPALFPTLNHIAVYMAHLGGTYLIYKIAQELRFKPFACNVAAIYFFISPAMLGTVLGIDSLNQAYSSFWGLLGTLVHLRNRRHKATLLWITCVIIGTLAKENAIVYLVIPQAIALAFGRITLRQAVKDTAWAMLAAAIYFAARKMLTTDLVYINGEYFENTFTRKLKNICVFLGMTWLPTDFVSLVYPPTRNIPTVIITALLSLPFMITLFADRRLWTDRRFLTLMACVIIAAAPHLLTLFTAMHPYAGLGMAALTTGFLADNSRREALLKKLMPLFIISCIFIDWHHWQKSYESGQTGLRMAKSIIDKTPKPVNNVCVIVLEDNAPKYSSFCVIPRDAFGLGKSVLYLNNYEWPKNIDLHILDPDEYHRTKSIVEKARRDKLDAIWLVYNDKVNLVEN